MGEVEEWKKLPFYQGKNHWYEVSNLGRVRSIRMRKPHKTWGAGKRKCANRKNRKYRLGISMRGDPGTQGSVSLENKLHRRGAGVPGNKIDPRVAVFMRRDGASFSEIGARFGASGTAAQMMLKRMGAAWPKDGKPTTRARPKTGTYTVEEALVLHKQGVPWERMAKRFGITQGDCIRKRLKRLSLI